MEERLEELLALSDDFARVLENISEDFSELASLAEGIVETVAAIAKIRELND